MRSACVVLAASLGLLVVPPALADAIEPPPRCPPGSRGDSSHSGEWCEPVPCDHDDECEAGHVCRTWRVCTRRSMVRPGGRRPMPSPPFEQVVVVATCAPDEACTGRERSSQIPTVGRLVPGRAECTHATYCVPEAVNAETATPVGSTAPPPLVPSVSDVLPGEGRCACSAPGARGGGASGLAITIAIVTMVVRRERRGAQSRSAPR